MSKQGKSGNGGRNSSHSSQNAFRVAEWLLLIGAILCIAVVGLSVAKWFWPAEERSQQQAKREAPRESPQKVKPLATSPQSLPDPETAPPQPAAAASGPAYLPPATVEALKEEALDVGKRLLNDFPNRAVPIALMGMLYDTLGNSAQALSCWETSVKLDPNCVGAYFGMGWLAARKAEHEKVLALCSKVLELEPTKPHVREYLADALVSLGRPGEAVAMLEKEIQINPRALRSHFLLGQAYQQLKENEKAKKHYETALEILPDYAEACYGLATVCARLGQEDQARRYRQDFRRLHAQRIEAFEGERKAYNDLLLACQRVAEAYTDIGRYYGAHGNTPKAEELWRRAAILDPKNARCRRQLTTLYQTACRDREALEVCEQLREIEPKDLLIHAHIGVLNTRLKRFDAAEEAFRKIVQIAPQRPEGYSGLAQLHLSTNSHLAEAKTLAATAVKLAPTAKNYSVLGAVCEKSGDLAGALAAWKRAVELDPDNLNYASIYAQIQQKQ